MMMMRREAKEDPGPCLPSAPCSSCPPPTREWDGYTCMRTHLPTLYDAGVKILCLLLGFGGRVTTSALYVISRCASCWSSP